VFPVSVLNLSNDLSTTETIQQTTVQFDEALRNVVENIKTLRELGELPDNVTIDDIDGATDVSDVVNLLKANDIVWHKGCRNQVDKQKVE